MIGAFREVGTDDQYCSSVKRGNAQDERTVFPDQCIVLTMVQDDFRRRAESLGS